MANQTTVMKNAGVISKGMAAYLADEAHFCRNIQKGDIADVKGKNGYKSGDTVKVNVPAIPEFTDTLDHTSFNPDFVEQTVDMKLDVISSTKINLTSEELARDIGIEDLAKRVIEQYGWAMAADIEKKYLERAVNSVANSTGTPGSNSFDTASCIENKTLLAKNLGTKGKRNRFALLNAEAQGKAVIARKDQFQSTDELSEQYKEALMGRADGFTYLENELLPSHTNGADVAAVVNGDSQSGDSLVIDGLSSGATVTKGSVFTIAGVYAVHPLTKAKQSHLQQFVVLEDASEGSGGATVKISPEISVTGGTKNVSALPADDADVTFVGDPNTSYDQNLFFNKHAFTMLSVPLELPKNAEFAASSTFDGITVQLVRDYDQTKREFSTRLDFLGAFATPRAGFAVRSWS